MWFSNRAQLNCGSGLSQPLQIVAPPPTVHHTTGAKPHHICRFFSPRFCFGVARRPLTCDCKLSWQSDMFLLYIKVGLVPTVWKVLTNFWQSVVNFPNPGTWSEACGGRFLQLATLIFGSKLLLSLFTIATLVSNLHISTGWRGSIFSIQDCPETNTSDIRACLCS